MEIWDVYTQDRIKTDKTMRRGDAFEKGAFHLVVHACIFNSNGEMLIQQRQPFKSGWPNMWDITVGGSAVAGDSSQKAIEREVLEEIGLKLDLQNVQPHMSINFKFGFDDIYLIEKNVDLDTLVLQYEEVQCVKWASENEILSMIDDEVFIPYHKNLIRLFFEMKGQYGAQRIK